MLSWEAGEQLAPVGVGEQLVPSEVGGGVGTGTLGGGVGRLDQRIIGGMVRIAGLGTGRAKCIILDHCISACVCSMPNCAVGEAGCGFWRAAMSLWIECVMFSCR